MNWKEEATEKLRKYDAMHLAVKNLPEEMKRDTATILSTSGTLEETEKAKILAVLQEVNGNRTKAAERLGISRRTIYRKLEEYGL